MGRWTTNPGPNHRDEGTTASSSNNLYGVDRLRSATRSPALRSFSCPPHSNTIGYFGQARLADHSYPQPAASMPWFLWCSRRHPYSSRQRSRPGRAPGVFGRSRARPCRRQHRLRACCPIPGPPHCRQSGLLEHPPQSVAATAPAIEQFCGRCPSPSPSECGILIFDDHRPRPHPGAVLGGSGWIDSPMIWRARALPKPIIRPFAAPASQTASQ